MPHRQPVRVVTGRHPYEVAVLAAAPIAAVALMATGTRPRSVSEGMRESVVVGWEIGLILAGLIALVGVWWPGKVRNSLAWERVGVFLLGTTLSMYVVAVFAASGTSAIVAGGFVGALAVASWVRVAQIWQELRKLDAVRDAPVAHVPMPVVGDGR